MLHQEFKILVISNDSKFSINLANECHKYGFNLSFIEDHSKIDTEITDGVIAVMIIDLNNENNGFELCKKIREKFGIPIFGVMNKLNLKMQKRAKENGFDLIFTKKMLLNSIREVVIHISK